MKVAVGVERLADGRCRATIPGPPTLVADGIDKTDAIEKLRALAEQVGTEQVSDGNRRVCAVGTP